MSQGIAHAAKAQTIDYADDGTTFEGYAVLPQPEKSRRPCVLLAHDWSGLTDPTKHLAERYASLGYVCFALDLYGKGIRGDPVGDNEHLMGPLMADRMLRRRRLLAGYEAARKIAGVDETRMAVAGYCFGGFCALELARSAPANLKAAVSFHGGLWRPQDASRGRIDASILLLHGWEDPYAPPSDVLAIAEELTQSGADWQLHAYGHAMHAFTFERANFPERGLLYDRKADERSWAAMRAHLSVAFGE